MIKLEEKVREIVKKIPKGKVITYSAVAKLAGRPKAARAVGIILRNNRDKLIPCHRVVHVDGSVGGYNGIGGVDKHVLLKKEGISIVNGHIDLNQYQCRFL